MTNAIAIDINADLFFKTRDEAVELTKKMLAVVNESGK